MGSARPRRASRRWMCAVGMRVRVDPIIAHNNGLCPTPPGLLAVDVRVRGGEGFGGEPGTTHDNGLCPTPPGLLAVDVRGRDAGPSRPHYCARQRALPNPAGPPGGGSAQ
ncbi:hypothetical protein RhiJN_13115 [Ceratobasidium sp. AG-Ba]|nr:hypothetical protein RhiJN_13115 [Ceratobasidium sp. AG-Ba]